MISILSEPIRSGKTTALINWHLQTPDQLAFLMPDLGEQRYLYCSAENSLWPLLPTDNLQEETYAIGRFKFRKEPFELAGNLLINQWCNYSSILIDEIGKLEFKQQQGFEPSLSAFLKAYKESGNKKPVLLVIRDYLLQEARGYYGLDEAPCIGLSQLPPFNTKDPLPNVVALILVGGQSKRMGATKALLDYHGLPQYLWLNQLLQPLADNIKLACKSTQHSLFTPEIYCQFDNPAYEAGGPLAALLTQMEQNPEAGILMLGCDYPGLEQQDIRSLTEAANLFRKSAAIYKPDNGFEPMLSYLHPKDFEAIWEAWKNGNVSLNHILSKLKALKVNVANPNRLSSFDTPTQYQSFISPKGV